MHLRKHDFGGRGGPPLGDQAKSSKIKQNQSKIKQNQAKSSKIKQNQAKSKQNQSKIKQNQAKSSKIKQNQAKSGKIFLVTDGDRVAVGPPYPPPLNTPAPGFSFISKGKPGRDIEWCRSHTYRPPTPPSPPQSLLAPTDPGR